MKHTKEIVVVSGKGGTGKTTITAAFAALASPVVVADCDVDTANLHLLLSPTPFRETRFISGQVALIREDDCAGCGLCQQVCRFDAVRTLAQDGGTGYVVDASRCEGCGVCSYFCPEGAIDLVEVPIGRWFLSNTRFGPMVHAHLKPGAGNSGKLVSTVREAARELAMQQHARLILVDGPPGIGCPVIASITGASFVLVVAEPTVSGVHDMKRIMQLTRHFGIPAAVCINCWDVNPRVTDLIEETAIRYGAECAGRIRHDPAAVRAQLHRKTVVEDPECTMAEEVAAVWEKVQTLARKEAVPNVTSAQGL